MTVYTATLIVTKDYILSNGKLLVKFFANSPAKFSWLLQIICTKSDLNKIPHHGMQP